MRQWVLSLPWRLRYHLDDAKLQNAVLHSFLRAIEQGLRQSLPETGGETRIGAVVFIHRFGGLLNAHLHFHVVVIDGVFCGEDAEPLRFKETPLTPEQVARIGQRITNIFVRRGFLDKAEGEALRNATHDGGFSLDANVRIEANDRQGLERLLRYCAPKEVPLGCARPAFAQERLRQIDPEHLVYASNKPGPGGKVSVLLTPHQLLDRLAALIPPPRRHRHRYYDQRKSLWDDQRKSLWDGVLAPNSPLHQAVTALAAAPESVKDAVKAEAERAETPVSQVSRTVWTLLLARIYDQRKSLWDDVLPLICPKCGGTMKIIAFIDEGEAIREILTYVGEPVDPPLIVPARGPPLWETAGDRAATIC